MPDEVTIVSTTDSPADLRAALGLPPEPAPVVPDPVPAPVVPAVPDPAAVAPAVPDPAVAAKPADAEPKPKTKSQLRIEKLVGERNEETRLRNAESARDAVRSLEGATLGQPRRGSPGASRIRTRACRAGTACPASLC